MEIPLVFLVQLVSLVAICVLQILSFRVFLFLLAVTTFDYLLWCRGEEDKRRFATSGVHPSTRENKDARQTMRNDFA